MKKIIFSLIYGSIILINKVQASSMGISKDSSYGSLIGIIIGGGIIGVYGMNMYLKNKSGENEESKKNYKKGITVIMIGIGICIGGVIGYFFNK